jgi:hypothetical protein
MPSHCLPMRAVALLVGMLAAAASLGYMGVAQLIWAQSEASYWLQLILAGLMLIGLFALARKLFATRVLGLAVLGAACVMAFMPVDNRVIEFVSIASRNKARPEAGDQIGGPGFVDQFASIAVLWAYYAVLLALFTFGVRYWFVQKRQSPAHI